jgi:hypothetical protein
VCQSQVASGWCHCGLEVSVDWLLEGVVHVRMQRLLSQRRRSPGPA